MTSKTNTHAQAAEETAFPGLSLLRQRSLAMADDFTDHASVAATPLSNTGNFPTSEETAWRLGSFAIPLDWTGLFPLLLSLVRFLHFQLERERGGGRKREREREKEREREPTPYQRTYWVHQFLLEPNQVFATPLPNREQRGYQQI